MTNAAIHVPGALQMALGLYAYLLPLLLYTLWTTLALWDIGRRQNLGTAAIWGWCVAIFLLPIVGPIAYLLVGGSEMTRNTKLAAVGGGAVLYLLVLFVGRLIGGIA